MCKFCEETDCLISEEIIVDRQPLFVDLRFDTLNNQLDIFAGFVDSGHGDWTKSLNIKFCPMCGEKLKEVE